MESTPQEEAEGQAIVKVLAVVLERLVAANSHLAAGGQQQGEETKFHALRAPAIGVLPYLERIHKYASCSKECFILALVYIDRLIQRNSFLLTDLNVHRVVITAVLLAAKFFDDAYYNNAYYAKVGGVLVSEMNSLEVEFLFKIDFGLRVLPEVFERYRAELLSHSSAVGMDRISHCTDEELFRGAEPQAQVQHQHQPVTAPPLVPVAAPQPQAPLLQTYSQELEPVGYQIEGQWVPLQHSASSSSSQMQVSHHQQTTAAEPVFPFPHLAPHVSVQHQSQAPPARNPTELDLVYHTGAPAATCTVNGSPLLNGSRLPEGFVPLHPPAAPQAQFYAPPPQPQPQPRNDGEWVALNPAPPQAQVYAPPPQPQPQPTNDGEWVPLNPSPPQAQAVYAPPPALQQPAYYSAAVPTLQPLSSTIQSHPEITPSPPPQPPITLHGAPVCLAYPEGMMGCSSALHHQPTHPYTANAAVNLHCQTNSGMGLLPSRPIAIAGNPQIAKDQEHHGGSWSRMVTFEGRGDSA